MSALVILLLVGLWAAILLPAALRARRQRQPLASANGFARTMTALAGGQRSTPRFHEPGRAAALLRRILLNARWRQLLAPPATPAARRRRTIVSGLAAASAIAVVVGAVVGGLAWALAAVSGAALAMYLGLVVAFVTRVGGRRGHPAPSSEAAAARAAAVRAAVARAPSGGVGSPDGALTHATNGPTAAAVGQAADAGARAVASDMRTSAPLPPPTNVSGNVGLVTIRTLPRVGGWPE